MLVPAIVQLVADQFYKEARKRDRKTAFSATDCPASALIVAKRSEQSAQKLVPITFFCCFVSFTFYRHHFDLPASE